MNFASEATNIILTVTYFYADYNYFHQIKVTIKGSAIMSKLIGKTYANIHIAHLELKMFEYFVHLCPLDMVEVFSWNYSKFLGVVNYKQEQQFDIKAFWDFGNSFVANIHIIFEHLYENVNVLMLTGKLKKGYKYTKNLQLLLLNFNSSHPRYTKMNLASL